MKNFLPLTLLVAFLAATLVTAVPVVAAGVPQQLPDPDGKSADQTKPLKAFIMLGQSNMLGFGRVGPKETKGSLEFMVKEKGKYPHLVDDAGNWTTRQDVRYVHVMDQRGVDYRDMEKFGDVRNEWLTPNKSFGPELGFGHVIGHLHDEPVLLLKACIGNRSLGWDLLPPGSERFEHEGKIYAGYKDIANFWDKGAEPKPVPWYAGRQYDADVAHSKAVLKNLVKYYPGYKGQGFEVAGFVWWQGHKDQSAALSGRYEQNLVHLIKSLRKDFDSPDAKFVLATGCGNPGRESFGLQIAEAQLAVDGDKGKYEDFPMNRALLVIDVQREYFEGAFPIRHPTRHLENILESMDAAKKTHIPTVVIRHHQLDPDSPVFRKGSELWQLHDEVETRPRDALIDKQLPGSFTNTSLDQFLKERNIDTVCIAGYMTQVCCDTTARQAFHRGYKVEFLRDATGTLDVTNKAGSVTAEQLHEAILVAQQMFISDVIDQATWLERIG